MTLTVDIGNTNICVAAFYDSLEPVFIKQYPDNEFHTAQEFYHALEKLEIKPKKAVLCSVVPVLSMIAYDALCLITQGEVIVVDSNFNDGLELLGYDRKKLGNDRIVDMTAVKELYSYPAVVFDMGTATTMSVINNDGAFGGGMIIPGLGLSLKALSSGTALLPGVKPFMPTSLLGKDTSSCINNGVIYAQASAIDGICSRVEEELGENVTVVVTGGAAKFILPFCKRQAIYDEHLLIKGLKILGDRVV